MTSFLTRCTTPNGSTADLPLPFFTPTTALPIPFMAGLDCLTRASGLGHGYQLPCPTLIIYGQLDRANGGIFPKSSRAWAARQPRAQQTAIPNAGHTAHQDNPETSNSILIDFLRRTADS